VQIIQRLRALFRKESTDLVPIDVNTLVQDVVLLLHADIERRRILVRWRLAEPSLIAIGDPVQLQQVVLNLLVNACDAIDAMETGPRVIVVETSRPKSGHLLLTVRDSGVGAKDSELERMFEHFVSSKPQGLGMGLAISRSIVEAHGGRIWATANADMGLTLHVELPLRP